MSTKMDKSTLIKWGITLGLTLMCFLVPQNEIITTKVILFLAITVCALALAAFELIPTMAIAILLPSCYILFKLAPASTVFSIWVSTTPFMIIGAFMLAVCLEDCGLLKRIAFTLLCKIKGSYLGLLASIMCVTILLNILTSGRGYLIMASLAVGLCMSLDGMQKNLGAGLAAAVMVGGCTSHAYTFQASIWGILSPLASPFLGGGSVTPLSIMLHNWPLFVVSLLILWISAKMFKLEEGLGEITYFKEGLVEMGTMTRREKVNLFMLAVLLVYIFTVDIHKLDLNLGFAIIPWMVYLPFLDGADENTVKKINFPMVFFATACMGIGTVAASLGIGTALVALIETILNGSTSPMLIVALIFAIVFVLNFLMTPAAIFALITVPVLTLVTSMGFEALPFLYAINACSEAILLPYEYVPYLVVYGFGMMKMVDFVKYNAMRSVFVFLGIVFVLVPYWTLLGLF